MICEMKIAGFKCFQNAVIPFRPLTIFCGPNGVGKSSVVQAILLSCQSLHADTIQLNGIQGLNLGSVQDVLCNGAANNIELEFSLLEPQRKTVKLCFSSEELTDQCLLLEYQDSFLRDYFQVIHQKGFTYLSAERQGPRDIQPTQSRQLQEQRVGYQGEYAGELLATQWNKIIDPALCHPKGGPNRRLGRQVELWMNELVPGLEIQANRIIGTNAVSVFFKKGGIEAEWRRQSNEGFGISYSLPIIVSGLLTKPGGLMIVDSPEAHLHPAAQAKITRFLTYLAASGVQVILETHSDHVLNGVRLASMDDSPLQREAVMINFFSGELDKPSIPITINQSGALSDRPRAFFDQSEKDLAAIVKSRRKGAQS